MSHLFSERVSKRLMILSVAVAVICAMGHLVLLLHIYGCVGDMGSTSSSGCTESGLNAVQVISQVLTIGMCIGFIAAMVFMVRLIQQTRKRKP